MDECLFYLKIPWWDTGTSFYEKSSALQHKCETNARVTLYAYASLVVMQADAMWLNREKQLLLESQLLPETIKQSNRYGWQTRLVATMRLKGLRIWAFRSLEMTHYRFSLTRLVNAQPWVVHNLWCHYKLISASIALPLWHVKPLAVRRHSAGNMGLKFSSIQGCHLNLFLQLEIAVKWLVLTFRMKGESLIVVFKWLGLIVTQSFFGFVPPRFKFNASRNSNQTPEILDLEVDVLQVQEADDTLIFWAAFQTVRVRFGIPVCISPKCNDESKWKGWTTSENR